MNNRRKLRLPPAELAGDLASSKFKTHYVGNRESGKLLHIYEKGKQLSDKESLRSMDSYRLFAVAILVIAHLLVAGAPGALAQTTPILKSTSPDLGTGAYRTNCAPCHQENGRGVASAFPPLAGHVTNLLAQAGGRGYLIRVLLFGLEGAIIVNGASFAGAMPAWNALDDSAIAAVLNHVVTTWDNKRNLPAGFKPFEAGEIAAARTDRMASTMVYALRQKLVPQSQQVDAKAPAATALSFTELQVAQGKTAYEHNCRDCHGSTLDNGEFGGAPLRGSYFRNRWGNGSVANLYAYTKQKMPPDRPGVLSDKIYAELVAYILQANGYEPGVRELPADSTAQQSMSLKRD
jgi:mono/diheme cytochrome c family protein